MAYTHSQREVLIAAAQVLSGLAVIGRWAPGSMPTILRRVSMVFTVAANAAGILAIKRRPTAGSAAGEVTLDTLIFDTTNGAAGRVLYVDLEEEAIPGEEFVFEVTDVAAAGTVDIKALIEERWEKPQNNADMTETA